VVVVLVPDPPLAPAMLFIDGLDESSEEQAIKPATSHAPKIAPLSLRMFVKYHAAPHPFKWGRSAFSN
jgi:hypothetical protein